jgi:hypothetical protein
MMRATSKPMTHAAQHKAKVCPSSFRVLVWETLTHGDIGSIGQPKVK